jgi:CPA2 family monovalent cation:H+ antiporter-2
LVVWGDAAAPIILEAAGIASARLLILATPDGPEARRVLEGARDANPTIDVVARTHSDSELAYLERQGVGMVVMGEREMALTMASYALQRLGVSDEVARVVAQRFRTLARAGIGMEAPLGAEPRGVPELQRRQAMEEGDSPPEPPETR